MLYGPELSGWQGDVIAAVRKVTSGVEGGGKSFSARVLDNLHARYISLLTTRYYALPRYDTAAGDAAAATMQSQLVKETGLAPALVRGFLVSLYRLAKSGKIPESKYDPAGSAARRSARSKADPGALAKARGALLGVGSGVMILAAAGVGLYLLSRKGK